MRARRPANATYWLVPVAAIPARLAAITAAVAESAPTTRWREEPNTANANTGKTIVYRPVITGMPAMVEYPMTSGMANAANVTPATNSTGMRARSMGSRPWNRGNLRRGCAAAGSPPEACRMPSSCKWAGCRSAPPSAGDCGAGRFDESPVRVIRGPAPLGNDRMARIPQP